MISLTNQPNGATIFTSDKGERGQVYGYPISPEDIIKIVDDPELTKLAEQRGYLYAAYEGDGYKMLEKILHDNKALKNSGMSVHMKYDEQDEGFHIDFALGIMYKLKENTQSLFSDLDIIKSVLTIP